VHTEKSSNRPKTNKTPKELTHKGREKDKKERTKIDLEFSDVCACVFFQRHGLGKGDGNGTEIVFQDGRRRKERL
jgi:hypothetical protein